MTKVEVVQPLGTVKYGDLIVGATVDMDPADAERYAAAGYVKTKTSSRKRATKAGDE